MSSNWEQKLFNYKADPPPSAWDAIAAGLDENKTTFPDKLYNYAEQPPATAWSAIEAQLPAAKSARVVAMPMRKKVIRYAAAAVVLLAIIGIAYFNIPGNNPEVAAVTNNSGILNNTPAPPVKREIKHFNVPPQPSDVTKDVAAAPRQKRTTAFAAAASSVRNMVPRKQEQTNLPVEPLFATELDVVPQEKNIINTDRADRYMIATSDDGEPVRLPKKVYSAFACPEDDPRQKACELQVTLLQQKMSSAFTTDFAQFLDLLKNLQEK